ncbi:MAG TPA: hypothetical protein V6C86_04525 [Oculatellaceae cyanobacterium]
MSQRPDHVEPRHFTERHDFREHQHIQPSHHEFQHHHSQHNQRRHHEQNEKHLVDKGTLPDLQLTHNGDAKPGQPAAKAENQPDLKAEGSKETPSNNGEVRFTGMHGAAVDTDGSGAHRHKEDRTRQNRTSLKDADGKSLDTDKDNFVALPKKEMERLGIKLGDHGYLQRQDTGEKVPVVFGDSSSGKQWKHGNGQPEASVAALKGLGFNNVDGRHGVDGNIQFNLIMQPGSRDKGLNV